MIPFLDLQRQYIDIADELEEAVLKTLRGGQYVLGEPVEHFEEAFAAYCGTQFAVACSTGTSALHLALLAAGIGAGDEVITVPTTFVATVAAILYCGGVPVLVDVDPQTLTMDPGKLAAAITPRTKAVLPVHFHGRLADMKRIREIADSNRLAVIEDAAQAHGARRDGQRAGAFGDMACFSFYPGKNLGAAGEGGAVTTDDADLAARVRTLRDWGQVERSIHSVRGYNYRMDAVQGAVLGVKLKRLDDWNAARQEIARQYDTALSGLVSTPAPSRNGDHVYHVYAVTSERRDDLRQALSDAGIATNIHYPRPVHHQPAYADLGGRNGSFPVAEAHAKRTLSLPIFAELTRPEVNRVVSTIKTFVEKSEVSSEMQRGVVA